VNTPSPTDLKGRDEVFQRGFLRREPPRQVRLPGLQIALLLELASDLLVEERVDLRLFRPEKHFSHRPVQRHLNQKERNIRERARRGDAFKNRILGRLRRS